MYGICHYIYVSRMNRTNIPPSHIITVNIANLEDARDEYAAKDPFCELNIGYEKKSKEWIDMSSPRPCSYKMGDDGSSRILYL